MRVQFGPVLGYHLRGLRLTEEVDKVAGEPGRLLPVERVASVFVDQQPGASDGAYERILLVSIVERVLRAPQDQRLRLNACHVTNVLRRRDGCHDASPHVRRDLAAFGKKLLEKRCRHRLGQCALLEFANEVRRNRIGERLHHLVELQDGAAIGGNRGADEDELPDSLGAVNRQPERNEASHGMSHDGRALDPEHVEQCDRIGRQVFHAVTAGRLFGLAVATHGKRDSAEFRREFRHDRLERNARVRKSVDEQHRLAITAATLGKFHFDAGRQAHTPDAKTVSAFRGAGCRMSVMLLNRRRGSRGNDCHCGEQYGKHESSFRRAPDGHPWFGAVRASLCRKKARRPSWGWRARHSRGSRATRDACVQPQEVDRRRTILVPAHGL